MKLLIQKIKARLFEHRMAVGIVPCGKGYRYVQLEKQGDDIRVKKKGVADFATLNGDLFGPGEVRSVMTAVDGPKTRIVTVELPVMREGDILPWMRENQEQVFPREVDMADFIHDVQVVGRTPEGMNVLFCSTWPDRVQETLRPLDMEGIEVTALSPRGTDLYLPFALWEEGFLHGNKALVHVTETCARVLIVESGTILFDREIPIDPDKPEGAYISDVEYTIVDFVEKEEQKEPVDMIYITGEGDLKAVKDGFKNVLCPVEIKPLRIGKVEVEPEYAHALGLALKKFYPILNAVNLLPDVRKKANKIARYKRMGWAWGLTIGSVYVLLMVIGLGLWGWGQMRLQKMETIVDDNRTEIELIERYLHKTRLMKEKTGYLHRLMGKRTGTARYLKMLSGKIPENLWLSGLALDQADDDGDMVIKMEGYALHGTDVSALLGNMEASSDFERTKLVYSEKIEPKKVYRLSGRRRRREVVGFKMETRPVVNP